MAALALMGIFALVLIPDLKQLHTFSLAERRDMRILIAALALIVIALLVGGVDRLVQWLEGIHRPVAVNLNYWLYSIAWNDLTGYFHYPSQLLVDSFRAVYNYGFYLPFFALLLGAVARRDFRMLSLLAFSTFVFHYLVHFPFYFFTEGHQLWLVQGIRPLFHTISPLNHVFPSMHASMAVTYLLLAWQQPNRRLKVLFALFCPLVIFSTFYLRIHWVVDALAGAAVGGAAVAFALYATRRRWFWQLANWLDKLPLPGSETADRGFMNKT